MGYRWVAILWVQIILVSFALAEDGYITESSLKGLVFNSEQDVQGNGFSNCYINASALNLSLNSRGHGSGSYAYESVLKIEDGAKYDDTKEEYKSSSDRSIAFSEDADFSYAPAGINLGRSMRFGGFQSLGSERTCIKNYGSNVSMSAAFDSASVLSKNLSASLIWKSTSGTDIFHSTREKHARANLNVVAAFSGRGHIAAVAAEDAQHEANILVDEDYAGVYQMAKNMTHDVSYKLNAEADDWLPCCSGGFKDMNPLDARAFKSAKGVFDCTCFKLPASN